MKRFFFLLGLLLFFAWPGKAAQASPSLLNFEIFIDEAENRIESRMMFASEGNEESDYVFSLPYLAGGPKEGSLRLESSIPLEWESPDTLRGKIGPAGLSLSYSYEAADSLIHARVISLDLIKLLPPGTQSIGRVFFSLSLREEDLPLVKEIFPYNWSLRDKTIEIELNCLSPGELLGRIYIEKDSYRYLKGNREYELNESQAFVLENYTKWFSEGIPFKAFNDLTTSFYPLWGDALPENSEERYMLFHNLTEHDSPNNRVQSFYNIFTYLLMREMIRRERPEEEMLLLRSHLTVRMWEAPLIQEMLRQQFYPDKLYHVAVAYARDPSLKGISTVAKPFGLSRRQLTEEDLLTAEKAFFNTILPSEKSIPFRIHKIYDTEQYSPEELSSFLLATGSHILVKHMILNNLDNKLLFYEETGGTAKYYHQFFSVSSGNISEETIRKYIRDSRWGEADISNQESVFLNKEDSQINALPLPAFTVYPGALQKEEDGVHYVELNTSYGDFIFGLELYGKLLDGEEAAGILAERGAEHEKQLLLIREKTEKMAEKALMTLPGFTEAERMNMRLACYLRSLNIKDREEMKQEETAVRCLAFLAPLLNED